MHLDHKTSSSETHHGQLKAVSEPAVRLQRWSPHPLRLLTFWQRLRCPPGRSAGNSAARSTVKKLMDNDAAQCTLVCTLLSLAIDQYCRKSDRLMLSRTACQGHYAKGCQGSAIPADLVYCNVQKLGRGRRQERTLVCPDVYGVLQKYACHGTMYVYMHSI